MRVHVQSVLNCSPEKVWSEVQKSSLLLEVIRPLVRIVPEGAPAFPERWQEGATVRCRSYLFGFIPLGVHTLHLERIDQAEKLIQSWESDPLIRRWDHLVLVQPAAVGQTLYSDTIEIEAGALTGLVWLFASWFYRHRQRRWRRVAERLAVS
jgi:hypothetical protein